MSFDAIVVLGCRVDGLHRLSPPAARRVEHAARAYLQGIAPRVVASGGKRWNGVTEASAFTERLCLLGVPRDRIVQEERSQTTVQNARFVAEIARGESLGELCIVTCDWHMERALAAFRHRGLAVTASAAKAPPVSRLRGRLRSLSERLHAAADSVVLALEPLR